MNDRFPRTLEEAFGPYTSRSFETRRQSSPIGHVLYALAWVAACAALLVLP